MSTLRKQVASELKTRDYVILTVLLLCLLYALGAAFFGDTGLLRYADLKKNKAQIEQELAGIKSENEKLKTDIDAFKNDSFYIEKNARENFGMANKDEYIFIYKKQGSSAPASINH